MSQNGHPISRRGVNEKAKNKTRALFVKNNYTQEIRLLKLYFADDIHKWVLKQMPVQFGGKIDPTTTLNMIWTVDEHDRTCNRRIKSYHHDIMTS